MCRASSSSVPQTLALAAAIGKRLKGGEVIVLRSDLGGGKTTFTSGLARGAGSHDQVSSPSFTITNTYHGDRLTLYHYDFYRLIDPGLMRQELAEVLEDPNAVAIIEWAGIVEDTLPKKQLTITLTATGEQNRMLEFLASRDLSYLLEGVVK